jgi:hypothetical protein
MMQRTAGALTKLLPPTPAACPHLLGKWLLRASRTTQAYRDGGLRPVGHRGGRLVVDRAACVWALGHAGEHQTADGRTWS